ncbi:MAG: class I SAM-dependent methyltransferase [Rivularia sp. (in: cyanobacteria)]
MSIKQQAKENFNSSKSFYKKDKLDIDLWFQIAQIDREKLIEQYSFDHLLKGFDQNQVKLLDIGCGTAKFPSLLDRKISGDIQLQSDLLDISEYCLEQAKQIFDNLTHFSTDKIYLSTVENINCTVPKNRSYDLIWAIHSLYTVDLNKMADVYQYCWDLLESNGQFLIYQFSENSFYYKLYDFYLKKYPQPNSNIQMMTYEDTKKILDSLSLSYEETKIDFNHTIDYDNIDLLEIYLKKCILDSNVDVLAVFQDILKNYVDRDSNEYKFPQSNSLITIKK